MAFSPKRPPPKSFSAQNLTVHWQCKFCGNSFLSEKEKDLHTSTCSHKEHLMDNYKSKRAIKTLPPPLHATGQGKVVKVSSFRSLSLDASLLEEKLVNLIWEKQCKTMDTEIAYVDNQNGVIHLKWDKLNKYYKNSTYLTPGNHTGCLNLTDTYYNGNTKPFYVQEKSNLIQEFTLSLVQADETKNSLSISSKEDTLKSARIKELEQKCEKLAKENEKLKKEKTADGKGKSSELESLKTAVIEIEKQEAEEALISIAGQKYETDIANSRLQKELDALKLQLGTGHKEKENLKNLDFDDLSESDQKPFRRHHDEDKVKVEKDQYFNMDDLTKVYELQNEVSELKKRCEEREREAAEAKTKSDELIDYLHGEKTRLESELKSAKKLNLLNRVKYSPAPNIPPKPPKLRSNPIPSNASTEPKKALFLASEIVLVKVPGLPQINH